MYFSLRIRTFGHDNIIRFCDRPFADAEEMNEALIENWNKKVSKQDIVYFLGDFALGLTFTQVDFIISRLNFNTLYFLPGNHEKSFRNWFQKAKPNNVKMLPGLQEKIIDGQTIVMTHYPMASWNKMRYGSWNLCGHTHGNYEPSIPSCLTGGKILDVGVDCHDYAPVSLDEIHDIMKNKTSIII